MIYHNDKNVVKKGISLFILKTIKYIERNHQPNGTDTEEYTTPPPPLLPLYLFMYFKKRKPLHDTNI